MKISPFLDLSIHIDNGQLNTKIYDKVGDFSFLIVNYPFLDGDVPLSPLYGVYISWSVRFARICINVSDFNERNFYVTEKLLPTPRFSISQARKNIHNFFFNIYKELILKYRFTCKGFIREGISHALIYDNILHKARKSRYAPSKITKPLDRRSYGNCQIVKDI